METFLADLAHSLRLFRRAPGFTAAAVAALALGIGANTAIFSVVDAVMLKPVPFPDPDRLVMFVNAGPQGEFPAPRPPSSRTGASRPTSRRTSPPSAATSSTTRAARHPSSCVRRK